MTTQKSSCAKRIVAIRRGIASSKRIRRRPTTLARTMKATQRPVTHQALPPRWKRQIENAADAIREHLAATDPYDFQRLIGALLEAMGYHIIFNAPPGPDQGIDLLAQRDPLGADGPRVSVQVKRRRDKATVEELRAFLALLADHDIGVFVSLGGFTPEAERLHRQQERRRITLIGFSALLDLWIQ